MSAMYVCAIQQYDTDMVSSTTIYANKLADSIQTNDDDHEKETGGKKRNKNKTYVKNVFLLNLNSICDIHILGFSHKKLKQ